MNSVLFILEIVGTVAFAASGAMVAVNKKMDVFGVIILGLTTAIGGGIIRDIILGVTPPSAFLNPVYAIVAIVTSVLVFLPFTQKFAHKNVRAYDTVLLICDSVGLGAFTVVGVRAAYTAIENAPFILAVFTGVITAVGGGAIRDLFAKDTPFIFVKHFYACASLIGAVLCAVLRKFAGEAVAMAAGSAAVIILRLLAAKYRWELPKPHDPEIGRAESAQKTDEAE